MCKYRLVYFEFKGRGELARLLFAAAKIEFEDVRLEYSQTSQNWLAYKPLTPFGKLAVLEIIEENGSIRRLGQSVAISINFVSLL